MEIIIAIIRKEMSCSWQLEVESGRVQPLALPFVTSHLFG